MSNHALRPGYLAFEKTLPQAHAALVALSGSATAGDLDAKLIELVKLRASQINGCAFCLAYHLRLARQAGLSSAKIDLVATWREAGVFTDREMAALEWAEQLSEAPRHGAPDTAWLALREHFSETQAMGLCVAIAAINAWNRVAVGLRFAPHAS